jgi:hypothetical protein
MSSLGCSVSCSCCHHGWRMAGCSATSSSLRSNHLASSSLWLTTVHLSRVLPTQPAGLHTRRHNGEAHPSYGGCKVGSGHL